ncbi:MAG: SUF system Fe-S cluster assembly regulator [Zymomonas mobilis subsp. pomaceae]|uniref:Transcriptional regulator, BadM/Rrf2 family n=1 Tax=Zymomonas mobilis subsp. pomaceae (strain ATCC 29192 / DSM 22645 / JCM 10191 / CCUG 17912 / NBRC 13757 / NCIMB 11200 / NRRL B-4491 / Barker I) TaxID=579138 RepID=F8ESB2_ZYMMT|nr:SUF system Fe-S cluster assembly regulator [Zymomonas mobilis]AEI37687.1 transcriptional regulator, BadM/Rrf2 family [Zymomonas mobilis subsp. pomaceae ATCC 29192]MDX5949054.1 SUF system Fe-S cluster assembly regulator [Zymomonas mobilis subsp. pomaceae]GEB88859.1 SUF system Fe-S cluster assembly regulator [Zymomonas mobilis subsp. pomaceae]
MRLSNLTDYAVIMLREVANNMSDVKCLTTQVMAEKTGIPLPTVQKLMGRLAATHLLVSLRGVGGGFTLARPSEEINLADIVEAVEGPIAMTVCMDDSVPFCRLAAECEMRSHWPAVNQAVKNALKSITLKSLAGAA